MGDRGHRSHCPSEPKHTPAVQFTAVTQTSSPMPGSGRGDAKMKRKYHFIPRTSPPFSEVS